MVKLKEGDFLIEEHAIWRIDLLASGIVYVGQQWRSSLGDTIQNHRWSRGSVRHHLVSGRLKHIPKQKANTIKVLYG